MVNMMVKKNGIPWNKGKKMSKDFCLKTSQRTTGKNNPFYGQSHTIESRKKMKNNHQCVRGDKNPAWKGGKIKTAEGYIFIYSPDHPYSVNNYVREHILVMEKHLGRYLNVNEMIHHIDCDKTNNNIENLFLTQNGKHQNAHQSIRLLIKKLLNDNIIRFDRNEGKYFLVGDNNEFS